MNPEHQSLTTVMVVPCYNEENRLDVDAFLHFVRSRPWLTFLFVDDGSTDGTADLIVKAERGSQERIRSVLLKKNSGKAEAVRSGLLAAFEQGPDLVGFWDADLATPLDEIDRFHEHFERQPVLEIAMGSRIRMLGSHIERKATRHYFGRVAATAVSLILGIPVYDTQCGAKLMRSTTRVRGIFEQPFLTRWAFDVEVLARWLIAAPAGVDLPVDHGLVEIPLDKWVDVAGSKLRFGDFVGAPLDIWRIYRQYGPDLRQGR